MASWRLRMEPGVSWSCVALRSALLLFLLLVAACQGQIPRDVAVGDNVTLDAKYSGSPTEITWKVNGNKYVERDLNPLRDPVFYRNEDRSTLQTNGTLTIGNVTKGDAGLYKAEPVINGAYQYTEYNLAVHDCLSKPIITNSTTDEMIIVTCKALEGEEVTGYEWLNSSGARVSSNPRYETPRPKQDVTLTCVVRNPGSYNTNSITFYYTGSGYGWIAAPVIVVLLILALFALWYFDCLAWICCCFDSAEGNCAIRGIDAVFRFFTCGRVKGDQKVRDGADEEAPKDGGGAAKGDKKMTNVTQKTEETEHVDDPSPSDTLLDKGNNGTQSGENKDEGNEREHTVL